MRKKRKKENTGNKRNNKKKNDIHVSKTTTRSKTVTQGKISLNR